MRAFRVHAEVLEDAGDHLLVFDEVVKRVLHFLARRFFGDEIQLEGGHLALREQRASLPQPQIPQKVAPALPLGLVVAEERRAHVAVAHVVQRAAFIGFAEDLDLFQAAVVVERHAGMQQQVAVADLVQAAGFQEEAHMTLQLLTAQKRRLQTHHDLFLFGRERIGVGRIDGRKHLVDQLVLDAVNDDGAAVAVDLPQQVAIVELEARILRDKGRLDLELDDGHSLLDLHVQLDLGRRQVGVALQAESHARIVAIGLLRERGERQNVDAVGVFQDGQVAVARADAHDVGNAPALPERGAHPDDVVVAPLDVDVVMRDERFHDGVGRGAAVVDVADDVQAGNGQALNGVRERFDQIDAAPGAHGGVHDGVVVRFLVGSVDVDPDQFFEQVGELIRQLLSHAAARVLASGTAHNGDQARNVGGVERGFVLACGQHELGLFARVVDQRAQAALFLLGKRIAEDLVDLQANGSRPVAQDMTECLGLAVDVGSEKLGPLRQAHDGAQVDDLGRSQLQRGEAAAEQLQITLTGDVHEASLLERELLGVMVSRRRVLRETYREAACRRRRRHATMMGSFRACRPRFEASSQPQTTARARRGIEQGAAYGTHRKLFRRPS